MLNWLRRKKQIYQLKKIKLKVKVKKKLFFEIIGILLISIEKFIYIC